MSEPFHYECPHCRGHVPVPLSSAGEAVTCTACGRPFHAALPVGSLVNADGSRVATDNRPAEREILTVRPAVFRAHPIGTLLFLSLAAAGAVALFAGLSGRVLFNVEPGPLLISGVAMMVGPLLFIGGSLLSAWATELKVTNRRTVLTKGIVSRSTSEVDHDDLRNVKCDQSLLERTFGYGDIALSSSGQDEMEIVVKDIPSPQQVLDVIRRYR